MTVVPGAPAPPVPPGSCADVRMIDRLASGDAVPPEVARHVESCPSCRARVAAARDDADFLGRVRRLSGVGASPQGAPRLPGYRILGVINSGAQGVVYRAMQESTSRPVAIKALLAGEAASPRQRARAEREAEIAARLRHPNIVTVFESRTLSDGRIAVIMEYVDGVPLDAWTPPGDTPGERQRALLAVFAAVAGAIHHAHLNGVIHRDLKPDNILVTRDARPVVLDFGIAKAGGLRTTLTGEFAGTPAYASPEQASGHSDDVDALTDVYSLGVILYRVLCRAMPYDLEGSIFDIARTISEVAPVPPRRREATLSPDLEAIILRAIRKDKHARYQSAAALARDIERYLAGEPVDARSGSGWYLLRKAMIVNRKRLALAGAVLLLLAGAGAAVAISLARAAGAAHLAAQRQEQARAEAIRARAVTELLREALPASDPARPELSAIIGSGFRRLYLRLESGAFADEPELDQAIRRLWGSVYTGFGSGKAAAYIEYAEVSLRTGLARLRTEHGVEHPEIATTMHELAGVLLLRDRAPEAERECRAALAMREKLLGPSAAACADSRALLARVLLALGRVEEAAREAEASLDSYHALGSEAPDLSIAAVAALRARIALAPGGSSDPEPLLREALELRLRRLPPEDPELHASLADAAEFAEQHPGTALARALAAAWPAREGESSPAAIRADVARLAAPDRGDFRDPVRAGRTGALARLLRLQEELLGADDPALIGTLTALMRATEGDRVLEVRWSAALRAADMLSKRFGPQDSSVLMCLEEASTWLMLSGRPDRAAELARRIVAGYESQPSAARDAIVIANSRRQLGWYLALAGRYADAAGVLRQAADEFHAAFGAVHHLVALTDAMLGLCLFELGDGPAADALTAGALELASALTSMAPDQSAHVRFCRGHVASGLGRHDEARRLLLSVLEMYSGANAERFAWHAMMLRDLAASSEALGDRAGAAEWRARLAALGRTQAPGDE